MVPPLLSTLAVALAGRLAGVDTAGTAAPLVEALLSGPLAVSELRAVLVADGRPLSRAVETSAQTRNDQNSQRIKR